MPFSEAEQVLVDEAVAFARAQRKAIAKRIADKDIYLAEAEPVAVFMAGSPGAGKTEASIELLSHFTAPILRIDPDELRKEFPGYNGSKAYLFQGPTARLVDAVLDQAFKNRQSFVLDGTFASYDVSRRNVERALNHNRTVQILYVYQEPMLAWGFVQAREEAEGRRILPEHFVEQYFAARDVVNRLKTEFGARVRVDLLMKNNDNSSRFYRNGVDQIDPHIPERVTRAQLENSLGLN